MRVGITPQLFQGQKRTDRQKADGPKLYGMLKLTSDGGRQAVEFGNGSGRHRPPPRMLWHPVLASMHNDMFSIVGGAKPAAGVWVRQRWYCETDSVART